ncbi:RIN4 pathogenic type III effector avirulence factor Avr cleavage site domain-containing protein [Abeliophyllum distichum]|uniref:RIN4 pathogenic type III effector avirulence factor Avr cleavage site domain-containing protein n=1 Tax=Abeliophyllum distichum TaxID=126358 RepID=A0ABD1SVX7_9LAMI
MEDRKERNEPWLSVPKFGDWDQKGALPEYSMDFSKIREMRKQNKRDPSRASLGNEEELVASTATNAKTAHNDDHHAYDPNHSPTVSSSAIFSTLSFELLIVVYV